MLKSIFIATIVVQQLATVEPAYRDHLGYETAARGTVSSELAEVWNAPAAAGNAYLLMRPESGAAVYLRFVEDEPGSAPPAALRTHGWNVTELLVKDPDALARKLEGSPFAVIGAPRDLYAAPNAPRAMQVRGPSGEVLYLTRTGGTSFDLGEATSFVDRTFIVVVGGPSMDELRRFYDKTLGLSVGGASPFPITVLSKAHSLPLDTRYPLALAAVAPGHHVELDQYPPTAGPRARGKDALPSGMAMVAFLAEDLDDIDARWRARPRKIAAAPYDGRRVAVTEGPAGEWLEIVESTPR